VARERLTLLGPAEHYHYLQYYDQIDVALDAFPYNGGTTTMEALCQGVPVLTFDGDRWASRTSQTLLRRTPWWNLVSSDVAAYIDAAVQLATDADAPELLVTQRRTMREELAASSACDTRRLAAAMEDVYGTIAADVSRR
jgi:predicted O-linked N-acetylglucosamine transferase (SPINDLY family)